MSFSLRFKVFIFDVTYRCVAFIDMLAFEHMVVGPPYA